MVRSPQPSGLVNLMEKHFVINKPRPGRSTATLVTHVYDVQTKRTKTVYLGSFSTSLDPDSIPLDAGVPPGGCVYGLRLSSTAKRGLETPDLAVIRAWLERHGTFRELRAMEQERLEQAAARTRQERERLRSELWPLVVEQVRAELEAEHRAAELLPPEAAIAALSRAAEYFVQEAERLRSLGHKVSSIRRAGLTTLVKASPLDKLQAEANRIRIQAAANFELACKAAGIMGKRKSGRAVK